MVQCNGDINMKVEIAKVYEGSNGILSSTATALVA
jgi:hypothetical protein